MHAAREIGLRRLNDEMEVVGHEHPGGKTPAEAIDHRAEEAEEGLAVRVGAEDVFAFVAAGGDVVDGAGILDTKRTCHNAPEDPSECPENPRRPEE